MPRTVICRLVPLAICCFGTLTSSAQDSDLAKLQAELNDTYIQAVQTAKLSRSPADVEDIKDSESKWRAYRDAECKAENHLSALRYNSCLVSMTTQRIAALKRAYLSNAN
jgi:uncharacterized protein YecT (DUF1311 family)